VRREEAVITGNFGMVVLVMNANSSLKDLACSSLLSRKTFLKTNLMSLKHK
jgi:hypothetical protein